MPAARHSTIRQMYDSLRVRKHIVMRGKIEVESFRQTEKC